MEPIAFLHDGTAVVVVDAGNGNPTNEDGSANPDYRAARVARLVTEEVEPEQFRDTDPALDAEEGDPTRSGTPGELRGFPAPPPSSPAAKGPAVTTRSTATEQPDPLTVPPPPVPLQDAATADTAASADRVAELEARNAQLERELQAARNDLAEPTPLSEPPAAAPLP